MQHTEYSTNFCFYINLIKILRPPDDDTAKIYNQGSTVALFYSAYCDVTLHTHAPNDRVTEKHPPISPR